MVRNKKKIAGKNQDDSWCRNLAGCPVGRYKLDKFIGAGKIGYVYRANHNSLSGCVRAVKLVFDTLKPGWENELYKVVQLELIDGVVYLTLYKGNVMIRGRESPSSLYNQELASMDIEGGFDQTDSLGFIKINALRLMAHHAIVSKNQKKNIYNSF